MHAVTCGVPDNYRRILRKKDPFNNRLAGGNRGCLQAQRSQYEQPNGCEQLRLQALVSKKVSGCARGRRVDRD